MTNNKPEPAARIAELQEQLQTSRRRVAVLEHRLAQLQDPDGARQMHGKFEMPTPNELAALHHIVVDGYPKLACDIESFGGAFRFVACLSRCDAMSNISNASWCDRMGEFLRHMELPPSNLRAFCGAVLAHGDVVHSISNNRFPFDVSFGLVVGGSNLPASSAWKLLLETGVLRTPVKLPKPVQERVVIDMVRSQY
jgi:hypothetical protein